MLRLILDQLTPDDKSQDDTDHHKTVTKGAEEPKNNMKGRVHAGRSKAGNGRSEIKEGTRTKRSH